MHAAMPAVKPTLPEDVLSGTAELKAEHLRLLPWPETTAAPVHRLVLGKVTLVSVQCGLFIAGAVQYIVKHSCFFITFSSCRSLALK